MVVVVKKVEVGGGQGRGVGQNDWILIYTDSRLATKVAGVPSQK